MRLRSLLLGSFWIAPDAPVRVVAQGVCISPTTRESEGCGPLDHPSRNDTSTTHCRLRIARWASFARKEKWVPHLDLVVQADTLNQVCEARIRANRVED